MNSCLFMTILCGCSTNQVRNQCFTKDANGVVVKVDFSCGHYQRSFGDNGSWMVVKESGPRAPRVTDEMVQRLLGNIRSLREARFVGCDVSGEACKSLLQSSDLVAVDFAATHLEDKDMSLVARLNGLTRLNLSGTRITDAGVQRLNSLNHLEEVWLDNTQITKKGVAALLAIATLKRIYVRDTQISRDEASALMKDFPSVDITTDKPRNGVI